MSDDWRKSRERRLLVVSASQHETFNRCERAWWLSKVRKLTDATTKSQVFGTVVHAVIERYLKADDLGRGADGLPVDLYPPGWQVAQGRFGEPSEGKIEPAQEADVRRLITTAIESGVLERLPGRRVEENFNRTVIKMPCLRCNGLGKIGGEVIGETDVVLVEEKCPDCGGDGHGCTVQMTGFIDVAFRDAVWDHKTTKSMRYAKSPAKLATNTQMMIYAYELLKQAEDRGEPLPQTITLRHNVYCAQENKVRKVEAVVTREQIEQAWQGIIRNSQKMTEFRSIVNQWHEIHDPVNPSEACNAYGGCAFRSICSGQETEESYEKRVARQKDVGYSTPAQYQPPPQIKGTTTVGNFDERLKAMAARNKAADVGAPPPTTIPAIPVATNLEATKPVPPPVTIPATTPMPAPVTMTPAGMIAPAAPTEVEGVGLVQPPPWAVAGCAGCGGKGFNEKGHPCRICDMKSKMANKPVSANYFIENLPDGIAMWMERTNEANVGYAFITGRPAQPVVYQQREATAPAAAAIPVATNLEATKPVPPPVEIPGKIIPAVTTLPPPPATLPPTASLLPPEAKADVPVTPTRKRRSKAEMAADAAANGPVVRAIDMGLILVLGAVCSKGLDESHENIEDVFANVGKRMADLQGVHSYYDLDPFKRRDAILSQGAEIAAVLGNCFLYCNVNNPDVRALVDALRPHAGVIINGIN